MKELVGDKIKSLRKSLNISQKSLAIGICSQSEISRIENNKFKPSYHVLTKISKLLGVNVEYFLEDKNNDQSDYIKEVKQALYQARRNRNYEEMEEIILYESDKPSFQTEEERKYLNWNKGIVWYHLHRNKSASIQLLLSCLSESNLNLLYTELDIFILNSIGLIYREENELEEAKYYMEHAYEILNRLLDSNNLRTQLKVMYNLSKIYTDLKQYKDSIKLCLKGLDACKEYEDMFLFAEFHYQLGRNYLKMSNEIGILYYERAKSLFEIDGSDGKELISKQIQKEINLYKKKGIVI